MTWSVENSQNDEASKIRWHCVPYFHGRVLDIGCGPYKCFPHWIGVDNGHHWGLQGADVKSEATDLSLFSTQSCDAVFSSHLLEHIPYENVPSTLNEWMRVIKKNGHLMLYIPADDAYPKCGEYGANPDHKWDCNYDNVTEALDKVDYSWDMLEYEHRVEGDEYSHWIVLKKL
tara:strand:- start:682 stop:1200 length:519 start_codon:yes stop_codon:yes gene_type:complete